MSLPVPELARATEALRFRLAWHQGGDPARLQALTDELQERSPWHPIALNLRARAALPETFLPPPEPGLAELGAAWLRGDAARVVALAREAGSRRARLVLAQLGEPVEALGDSVEELAAARRPVDALVRNPLYGTARVLLVERARAEGRPMLRLPLVAPVQRREGRLSLPRTLSERAARAWTAWHRAVSSPLNTDLPPGSAGHRALLEAWRAGDEAPARFREDPDPEIRRLDQLDREGLLPAYEWSCGLAPSNAPAFRAWAAQDRGTLRRLWTEGLRA